MMKKEEVKINSKSLGKQCIYDQIYNKSVVITFLLAALGLVT